MNRRSFLKVLAGVVALPNLFKRQTVEIPPYGQAIPFVENRMWIGGGDEYRFRQYERLPLVDPRTEGVSPQIATLKAEWVTAKVDPTLFEAWK